MSRALVLVGPSAVGKTTVMNELLSLTDRFLPIRSMTTRPARSADDTEYLYVSEQAFAAAVRDGELLEHMTYGTHSYGTPRSELRRVEAEGKCPLLILDLVGARALKTMLGETAVHTVYLYDSLDVMETRLYTRELAHTPSADALTRFVRRKEANIRDYLTLCEYAPYLDVLLSNTADAADAAALVLRSFLTAEITPHDEKTRVLRLLREMAEKKENYRIG